MLKAKLLVILLLASPAFGMSGIMAKLNINGKNVSTMDPAKPAVWEIEFFDQKKKRIRDFEPAHMKIMHLVVIKSDLSHFAHFHPYYDKSTGIFQASLNLPAMNPDNQDAKRAILKGGDYHVVAEVKSKKFGFLKAKFDVKANGRSPVSAVIIDKPDAKGFFVKNLTAKGKVVRAPSDYKFVLKFDRSKATGGGENVRIFSRVLKKNSLGKYKEVKKLERWLGMGGHAILTSFSGRKTKEKLFAHFHAMGIRGSGELNFSYFNRGALKSGNIYKMWIQFKHRGVVFTAPLSFRYP